MYMLASPTHITEGRIDAIKKAVDNGRAPKAQFYVSTAPEEEGARQRLAEIETSLASGSKPVDSWRQFVYKDEDHYTTPAKTIQDGFNDYFADYKPIRFYSLQEYDDYGGLEALRSYYRQRGERYGLSTEIHSESRHFLILGAMKVDDFDRFEYYNHEFDNYIEKNIKLDVWVDKYARFYLKHGKPARALTIFQNGLENFPKSALIYAGMGDLHRQQQRWDDAEEAYLKAVKLATADGDTRAANYQKNLDELRSSRAAAAN